MQPRNAALFPNLDSILLRVMAEAEAAARIIPRFSRTHEDCLRAAGAFVKGCCESRSDRAPADRVAALSEANVEMIRHHLSVLQELDPSESTEQQWARWADHSLWLCLHGATAAINRAAGGKAPISMAPLPSSTDVSLMAPLAALTEPLARADLLRHVGAHPELTYQSGEAPPEGWAASKVNGYVPFYVSKPGWMLEAMDAGWESNGMLDRPSTILLKAFEFASSVANP
jgi:hypothetical protein